MCASELAWESIFCAHTLVRLKGTLDYLKSSAASYFANLCVIFHAPLCGGLDRSAVVSEVCSERAS